MSEKTDWFWHLTLNTGDTRKSYRNEISDEVLDSMRAMNLLDAEANIPIPGNYRIKTAQDKGGAVFTIFRERAPLVVCMLAIAPEDADYWMIIEKMYLKLTDTTPLDWALPEKPVSTPWLAVILVAAIALDPEAARWLGDFERCMAWLLMDQSL